MLLKLEHPNFDSPTNQNMTKVVININLDSLEFNDGIETKTFPSIINLILTMKSTLDQRKFA